MKDRKENIFWEILWDHTIVKPRIIEKAIEYFVTKRKKEREDLKDYH